MAQEIQNPEDSKQVTLILNQILEMDEPYLSVIADTLDKKIGALQRYTETMLSRGWIQKERQGRKVVYTFHPEEVWKGYSDTQRLDENYEDLDDAVKEYLNFSLRYQIILAVDTAKPDSESLKAIKTLREMLQETTNTVLTTEATLQELGVEEKALDELSDDEMIPVTVYLNLIREEWTASDAERILEEMKEVSYSE